MVHRVTFCRIQGDGTTFAEERGLLLYVPLKYTNSVSSGWVLLFGTGQDWNKFMNSKTDIPLVLCGALGVFSIGGSSFSSSLPANSWLVHDFITLWVNEESYTYPVGFLLLMTKAPGRFSFLKL